MKKAAVYFFIVILANLSFLLAPPPGIYKGHNADCPIRYVQLNNYLGFQSNCDALAFIGLAIDPSYLLDDQNIRQSRPLFILLGTITGYPIYFLSKPFHPALKSSLYPKLAGSLAGLRAERVPLYISVYLGYIFINIIILVLSLLLFENIVHRLTGNWKNSRLLFFFLLFILAANPVTETYFWTPHPQMFNILTPLLCIYLSVFVIDKKPTFLKMLIISACSGFLVLVYGSFLLLLPFVIGSYLVIEKNKKAVSVLLNSFLLVFCFVLPTLLWFIILKIAGVTFYSYEFAGFRQFIWIADSLKISLRTFVEMLGRNTLVFIKTSGSLIFPLFLLFLIKCFAHFTKPVSGDNKIENRMLNSALLLKLSVLVFVVFFWLLGYYADRLTFSLAPIILLAFAITLNRRAIPVWLNYLLIALIAIWHLYSILFEVPHFSDRYYY